MLGWMTFLQFLEFVKRFLDPACLVNEVPADEHYDHQLS
jgi:hypothetical protein